MSQTPKECEGLSCLCLYETHGALCRAHTTGKAAASLPWRSWWDEWNETQPPGSAGLSHSPDLQEQRKGTVQQAKTLASLCISISPRLYALVTLGFSSSPLDSNVKEGYNALTSYKETLRTCITHGIAVHHLQKHAVPKAWACTAFISDCNVTNSTRCGTMVAIGPGQPIAQCSEAGRSEDTKPSPRQSAHTAAAEQHTSCEPLQSWHPASHLVGSASHLFSLTLDSPVHLDTGTVSLKYLFLRTPKLAIPALLCNHRGLEIMTSKKFFKWCSVTTYGQGLCTERTSCKYYFVKQKTSQNSGVLTTLQSEILKKNQVRFTERRKDKNEKNKPTKCLNFQPVVTWRTVYSTVPSSCMPEWGKTWIGQKGSFVFHCWRTFSWPYELRTFLCGCCQACCKKHELFGMLEENQ